MSKSYYAEHVRRCGGGVDAGEDRENTSRGRRGPSPQCGTVQSVANKARHLRTCRLVCDPGGKGEPRP